MGIIMIDIHAHFNFDMKNLQGEIDKINESALTAIINPGLDLRTSREAIDIANANEKFFATIGVHPLFEHPEFNFRGDVMRLLRLYDASPNDKIVAVGETGLDINGNLKAQSIKFIQSIELANILELPVMIHARGTNEQVIEILKTYMPQFGFVYRCFHLSEKTAQQIIDMGGFISLIGPATTRDKIDRSFEVIKEMPLGHLLIENDYPYIDQRPESEYRDTFNRICELRDLPHSQLQEIVDENAQTLFKKLKREY